MMGGRFFYPLRGTLSGAALFGALALAAASPAAAQQGLRPAVGKPLEAASAYENSVIAQMKAASAQASGDSAAAAALINSGQISGPEATKLMQGQVSMAFREKNYPQVVYWAERYMKSGGGEPSMKTYVIQGYYLQGKYAEAAKLQAAQIQAETRGGRAPVETQLQLLYSCQTHLNDHAGQLATIKQLVAYYPKPDYWLNLILNVRSKPDFPERLLLDVFRLEFSLGLVNKPDDAMELAELAVQAKLPGVAKDVVDKSFAGGLLGTGPEASRHLRLKALVDKTYDADKAALGKDDAAASSDHDGNALLGLGETYVSYGMYDKGIPMMLEAIQKGDLHHKEDAKLQLGLAYWKAGQKPKAIQTLKTVSGTDGAADLAQLWILRFRQP
jgi:hypothetical protein